MSWDINQPDAEQHEALLRALTEYSEKLRALSLEVNRRSDRIVVYMSLGLATYILGLLALLILSQESRSSYILFGGTAALTLLLVSVGARFVTSAGAAVRFELMPIQSALRKLLNRASKLETHSISSPDLKVIFDLKLAEAEAAIAICDWVLERQARLSPLRLFLPFPRHSLRS